jgi:hypothetical protein
MQQFNVRFGYTEYKEKTGGKERPVVIIGVNNINNELINAFGVYTYRRWFNFPENEKMFYEIKDLKIAGLHRRSFANISRFSYIKIAKLDQYKYLGRLSKRDIEGLYAKAKEYNNSIQYRVQLDEFLKDLDLNDVNG